MSRPRTKNTHLPRYVTVIHGSYWYRPPTGDSVNIGPEGAEHLVWKFMAEHTAPEVPKTGACLKEHFERYKREIVPTLAPRTQKDYARHLAILERTFGHMRPDDLIPKDIGKFLDKPKGRVQANRQIAVLSSVYSYMVGSWWVAEKNPCRDVKRNKTKKRTRYVSDEEYAAFYNFAKPRVQIMMDLALITGQRQGDLIALQVKNVTDDGVLFQQGKTGKRLLVGMSDALAAVIRRAKQMEPKVDIGGYLVRTRKGTPYTSEGFRACWQRTMQRAMRKGILAERFTFHDLRAKSVSDSKTLEEAFERAGHTSMQMTRGTYDRGVRKVTPLK